MFASLMLAASLAASFETAPLGIAITNCTFDTYGVAVRFETDLPPPYLVGVYECWEDGLARNFPIAEVRTFSKSAFVPGDFTDVTSFVEVMHPSRINPHMPHRVLTAAEAKHYRETLDRHVGTGIEYTRADINYVPNNIMGQLKGMELIGDHTWQGFVWSSTSRVEFAFRARRAVEKRPAYAVTNQVLDVVSDYYGFYYLPFKGGRWQLFRTTSDREKCPIDRTETTVVTNITDNPKYHAPYVPAYCKTQMVVTTSTPSGRLHVAEYAPEWETANADSQPFSVDFSAEEMRRGLGYRIVHDDATGETIAQRAYSARTNCSNTVYLPRLFRGLSVYQGYRLTMDANGVVICVPADNKETAQ